MAYFHAPGAEALFSTHRFKHDHFLGFGAGMRGDQVREDEEVPHILSRDSEEDDAEVYSPGLQSSETICVRRDPGFLELLMEVVAGYVTNSCHLAT